MQEARAPSTRAAYTYRWRVFTGWCQAYQTDPFLASTQDILLFLQIQFEAVTLRGMLAAIKAVCIGEFAISEDGCSMISRYLRGARRLTASSRAPQVPTWNLYLVLEALKHPPFEPLGNVDRKWLSLKTAFLLAITSARRIGELHALSVHRDCCTFSPEGSKVVLRPNPAFLPKVLSDFHLSQSIELQSLPVSAADQLALCPVRAAKKVRPALCVFSH